MGIHASIRWVGAAFLRAAGFCLVLALPLAAEAPVVVGVDRDFPPYEYVDDQGRPAGFLVDLVQAAAAESGLAVEIRAGVWADLRHDLVRKRIDLLSGMFYTEPRARNLSFTVPHSYPRYAIFRRRQGPDVPSEAGLRGHTILVEAGDLAYEILRERGLRVIGAATPREALERLAQGQADCAVLLKAVGLFYLKQGQFPGVAVTGAPLLPQKYCFAVRPDKPELLSRLNEGLFILQGSGKYAELYRKHFDGLEPSAAASRAVIRKRLLVVLVPAGALLLGALTWTWFLRRLVRQRTRSLRRELAERQRVDLALQATDARYTRLFRSMTDAYIQVDLDGRIVDSNPAYRRMLGYTEDELLGHSYLEFTPAAWHARHQEIIDREVLPLGSSQPYEKEYRRKDGTLLRVEVRDFLLADDQGRPCGYWGLIRDITDRYAAREESGRLRRLLEQVVENAGVWINTLDLDGRVVLWNRAAMAISGYTKAEVQNNPDVWALFYPDPDSRAEVTRWVQDLLGHQAQSRNGTTRLLAKDGTERFMTWDCCALVDEAGGTTGLLTIGRDITESRKAEEALRESERMQAHLIANLPGFIYQAINVDGWPLRFISEGCRTLTGYGPEAFQGEDALHINDLTLPGHREAVRAKWLDTLARSEVFEAEYPIRHADGEVRWVWERSGGVYDGEGRLLMVEGFLTDITRRKRTELALAELRESWAQFVRHSPVLLFIKEATETVSRMLQASDNCAGFLGAPGSSVVGKTMAELFPADMAARITAEDWRVVSRGEIVKVDEEVRGRSFTAIKFPIRTGERTLLGGYAIDTTEHRQAEAERLRLESQLQQAQKMESIGSLAGGVAHDMNNVLGAILALATVERERAAEGSPLRRNMDTVTKACVRGASLVKGLLGFARKGLAEERVLDLNAVVREEVAILERTTLQKVSLAMELAPDLRPVKGDAAALTHALMNLCVNAVDAMPEGGRLTLCTRNLDPSTVLLEVSDTGCGMPEDVVKKAMDPFFTTKPLGQGTGLGLSIVYGTVKAHHGQLHLQSLPGTGTTVSIQLPAHQAAADPVHPAEPPEAAAAALRVLVVDDDELIRESTGQILRALGHVPTVAAGGAEALELLRRGLDVDRVVLDLNMPGMGGVETLARLRELRPDLPVLLATGRPDQEARHALQTTPAVSLLPKPYTAKQLLAHLR